MEGGEPSGIDRQKGKGKERGGKERCRKPLGDGGGTAEGPGVKAGWRGLILETGMRRRPGRVTGEKAGG